MAKKAKKETNADNGAKIGYEEKFWQMADMLRVRGNQNR